MKQESPSRSHRAEANTAGFEQNPSQQWKSSLSFLIRELTIATACDSLFLCLLLAFVLFCLRQCLSIPNWPGTGSEDQVGLELTETLSTLPTHAGVKGVPNRPGHTSFLLIFPYTSWATVLSLTNCVCPLQQYKGDHINSTALPMCKSMGFLRLLSIHKACGKELSLRSADGLLS